MSWAASSERHDLLTNTFIHTIRALRKTSHVLRALAGEAKRQSYHFDAHPLITYYALDLELRELQRTLGEIRDSELGQELDGMVATKGLCGTYEDGMKFVKYGGLQSAAGGSSKASSIAVERARDAAKSLGGETNDCDSSPSECSESRRSTSTHTAEDGSDSGSPPSTPGEHVPPLHLLFLGSSLGNFSRAERVEFLKSLPMQADSGDTLLLGLDHANPKDLVELAYNDKAGYTKAFIMHGLQAAGRTLGDENLFDEKNWEYFNVCLLALRSCFTCINGFLGIR